MAMTGRVLVVSACEPTALLQKLAGDANEPRRTVSYAPFLTKRNQKARESASICCECEEEEKY